MPSRTGRLASCDGVQLAYRDHAPGQESAARTLLLLHGLAGHLGERDELLPPLLAQGHRVVTYDARGHGASTGRPADMSRAACVRDTVTVIRELGLDAHGQAPLTLVGQYLGGHTAFLTAAAHPELIHLACRAGCPVLQGRGECPFPRSGAGESRIAVRA
ncbi:alpha/beta fold hydrolase, partial [Streptomyces europaeiscabiei]